MTDNIDELKENLQKLSKKVCDETNKRQKIDENIIIENFMKKILFESVVLDPEFMYIVDENFWELF